MSKRTQATKLLADSRTVVFDFAGPACLRALSQEQTARQATQVALVNVVQANFPQGLGREDGRVWAAWQEALSDEATDKVEMPARQARWLRAIFAKDELRVPTGLAQAREAVLDYLDALLAAPEGPPDA